MLQLGGPGLRSVRQLCVAYASVCRSERYRPDFLSVAGQNAMIFGSLISIFDTAKGTGIRIVEPAEPSREASMKRFTYLAVLLALALGISALPVAAQTTGMSGVCN